MKLIADYDLSRCWSRSERGRQLLQPNESAATYADAGAGKFMMMLPVRAIR